MNNKTLLMAGGVVLVIIIAVIAFSFIGKPQQVEEQTTTPAEVMEEKGEEELFSGSILNLLKAGRNVECTFSRTDEAGTTSGHVYLSGENMYGEFMTNANNQTFDAYVIRDGENAYTWSSLSNQGTKITITDEEVAESDPDQNSTDNTLDEDLDLKCKPWSADSSMFSPPSNIEFTDLTEQVEQIQGVQQQQLQNLQSVCDQLTGQSKQQCLDALNTSQ